MPKLHNYISSAPIEEPYVLYRFAVEIPVNIDETLSNFTWEHFPTSEYISYVIGKESDLNEILGTEMHIAADLDRLRPPANIIIRKEDFKIISRDQEFIRRAKEAGFVNGYNPFVSSQRYSHGAASEKIPKLDAKLFYAHMTLKLLLRETEYEYKENELHSTRRLWFKEE